MIMTELFFSGFLTLIKNLVTNHTINTEQLMRGGGVAIIGALLLKARPKLIDVNVLMATQLLVELAHVSKVIITIGSKITAPNSVSQCFLIFFFIIFAPGSKTAPQDLHASPV